VRRRSSRFGGLHPLAQVSGSLSGTAPRRRFCEGRSSLYRVGAQSAVIENPPQIDRHATVKSVRRTTRPCGRGFTPAPPELRAKTYPLRVILDGVTLYNLGYTLAETSAKLKTKDWLPRAVLDACDLDRGASRSDSLCSPPRRGESPG